MLAVGVGGVADDLVVGVDVEGVAVGAAEGAEVHQRVAVEQVARFERFDVGAAAVVTAWE